MQFGANVDIGKMNIGPLTGGWVLAGLFVLALLLRLVCFTGLVASDDVAYAENAQRIANGTYILEYHHFAIRYAVLLPIGLVYAIAGVSEWSTIAVPLLASSLSVVLMALIAARLFSNKAALIAALLMATFPLQVRFATVVLPEPIVECYVLLAILVYVWTEERAQLAWGALAGALIAAAYLAKEPALFIFPALAIDAAVRRRWRHAFGIILGATAVIGLEHAYYMATSSDLLFRLHAMAVHNQTVTSGRRELLLDERLWYRLFLTYPRMMLVPNVHLGLHSLAAIILAFVALLRFRRDRRVYFLLIWALVPFLYLNFGSSSLTKYIPIPVAARYIDFAYPPLFLLSAWLIADSWSKHRRVRLLAVPMLAIILVAGLVCGLLTRATAYRTTHVAVLRSIAESAQKENIKSACIDIPSDKTLQTRWRQSLFILSAGGMQDCNKGLSHVVIRADPLGLPYIASREPALR